MTKVVTTRTTTKTPKQEEPSSISFYSSRRLKLCTPAEIEHCESSETIAKYINAKIIQSKNTGTIQGKVAVFCSVRLQKLQSNTC
jgi:hypothetical protein